MTTANKITVIRILMIPVFVTLAIYYGEGLQEGKPQDWQRFAAIAVFLAAALSDGLDGFVARHYNQRSSLGMILDPIADKGLLLSGIITLSISNWSPGDPNAGNHTSASWFNTSVFSQPAPYTFGNAGVGIVRGPGLVQVDMSLIRDFKVTDKIHTEFRAEIFNVINRTNFGNPGTVFGSSTFGVISSAAPARQIQLGLRVTF